MVDIQVTLNDLNLEAEIAEDVKWAVTLKTAQILHPAENCTIAHLVLLLNHSGMLIYFSFLLQILRTHHLPLQTRG